MSHDTWQYVLNSGVWSVVGLLIGYALGRLEVRASRLNDNSNQRPAKKRKTPDDHSGAS